MENPTVESNETLSLKCNMTGSHKFIFTFVPVVYACNFVIGIVGNSMVVAVIYRYMKLKTVANVFVLNLAVSDLTFLVTLPMWATFTALGYNWPFGSFLCKASAGLAIFNLYTSIFFLTALSVDRYLAIVHPVGSRQRRTLLYARLTCVLLWVFAFVLSMPTALSRDTMMVKDHPATLCGILQRADHKQLNLLVSLSILKTVLGFLVPFLIIITCDCLMGCALLKAKGLLRKSARSREDETLRMLVAAVLAFFVCWAPHQIFHFMELLAMLGVVKDCHVLDVIDTAMPFSVCLAYFNSCVNPILYGFVGHNFRKNLLRLLHCEGGSVVRNSSISTKMTAMSTRASQVLHLSSKKSSECNANTVEDPKT
ncbi:type-1 angiotensin II receptor [Clarias gariepinus]|uniref:type-1 angiotensin II receptor n=1 Tax=Clarias gariepinus TaxID=13013 RepID=UPI00234DFE13|nr:type-1 angiotensin II receptor [Clarias gariepinus]